jgi:hypothetical protein
MLGRTVFWRALALGAHIGAPLQFAHFNQHIANLRSSRAGVAPNGALIPGDDLILLTYRS